MRWGICLLAMIVSVSAFGQEKEQASGRAADVSASYVEAETGRRYSLPAVPREAYILPPRPPRYEPRRGTPSIKHPHLNQINIRPSPLLEVYRREELDVLYQRSETTPKTYRMILGPNSAPRNPVQRHIPAPSLSDCHTARSRPDVPHPC